MDIITFKFCSLLSYQGQTRTYAKKQLPDVSRNYSFSGLCSYLAIISHGVIIFVYIYLCVYETRFEERPIF